MKAVIFDLDGVITDSAKYHYLAWKRLAEELGIPFDEEYNEKLKGVSRMESLNLILERGQKKEAYSAQEKEEMADKKNTYYKKYIECMTPDDILPGIREFLSELKTADIKTGVASVSQNAYAILERLGLFDSFDYVADAGKISRAKPYPDIFLSVADALGVDPVCCVGVEDAETGIQAIKAAGMKAVGVGTPERMAEADLILSGTNQLSLEQISCMIR